VTDEDSAPIPPLAFVASDADVGRIDAALGRRFPGAGRRRLSRLFDRGAVRLEGKRARKGDRVIMGAHIELTEAPTRMADLAAAPDADAAARLMVLWRGDDAVAVAKPPGMPSQPLEAGERGTVANGLVHAFPGCASASPDPRDGGLVQRLDIATSGVLIAATTPVAWRRLRAAFSAGRVTKRYLALTTRVPARTHCEAGLVQRGNRVVVDDADGLFASTDMRLVASSSGHHLIACTTHTGRMHQIRAHLAHVGAPIVGDALYGGDPSPIGDGAFLHAWSVGIDGELQSVIAPLPTERQALLQRIGIAVPDA